MNQMLRKSRPRKAEPTWEIAHLFPAQGYWSEEDYLELDTNWLVEFTDGYVEVLPMPTTSHQLLVAYLYGLLFGFVSKRDLGTVVFAPLRVRLRRGKFRLPDLVFMRKEHARRVGEEFWEGADLAMEVVSEGSEARHRDFQKKRQAYARAGISEYWIVDPLKEIIMVLRLAGTRYVVHGEFPKGTVASSHLLPDFQVDVTEAFKQANRHVKKKGNRNSSAEKKR
jgi:Uma2 family endonuclease